MRTEELAKLAGVTLRQLQWWDEQGIISAKRKGHSRYWLPADVWRVLTAVDLRKKGLSLKRIRFVLSRIKPKAGWLVTDGRALCVQERRIGDALVAGVLAEGSVYLIETVQP